MLPLEHSAIPLTCIKRCLVFLFVWPLKTGFYCMISSWSIYIYAYKSLCRCVGRIFYPHVNWGQFDMLGPIISENDPPFFASWVTFAHQSWTKSEALQMLPKARNIPYLAAFAEVITCVTTWVLPQPPFPEIATTGWLAINWAALHWSPSSLIVLKLSL